mgnify:CR=1 FL=1
MLVQRDPHRHRLAQQWPQPVEIVAQIERPSELDRTEGNNNHHEADEDQHVPRARVVERGHVAGIHHRDRERDEERQTDQDVGGHPAHRGQPPDLAGELLALFSEVLRANGGPQISDDELGLHFDLAVGSITLALLMDTPALLLARMPDIDRATGPHDPLLQQDKVVQGFLHTFTAALNLWERRDFAASLDSVLESAGQGR